MAYFLQLQNAQFNEDFSRIIDNNKNKITECSFKKHSVIFFFN